LGRLSRAPFPRNSRFKGGNPSCEREQGAGGTSCLTVVRKKPTGKAVPGEGDPFDFTTFLQRRQDLERPFP